MTRVRPAPPRRGRLALSLLVWALCALLGTGPTLQALHFSLVQHRICPEHRELLHVSEEEASPAPSSFGAAPLAAAASPATGSDVPGAQQGAGGNTADSHDHDACGVSVLGSVAAVWPAEATTVAALAGLDAARREGAERAHLGIALLHYAPKLEPPSQEHLRLPLDASVLV